MFVEQACQLADRHAMAHRNREHPDKRLEARDEDRPFDLRAADRVGPIADDDLQPAALRRLQTVGHRVDVGVNPDANVLQIDHEDVEIAEHVVGRFAGLAVERVHGDAADLVAAVPRLDHVVLHVGSEAVLRAEDGGKARARVHGQAVGDVPQVSIDRSGVADDADPRAVEACRVEQTLGPERDAWRRHVAIICTAVLASGERH